MTTVPVDGNRRWVVKQTLVPAFADVTEKLAIGGVYENKSTLGVGNVNVVGSVHRDSIRQQQAALWPPGDSKGFPARENVNRTNARVNDEDTSQGVNRNAMGRSENWFPPVSQGNNVIP
jgi:hypothetical protein